MNILENIEQQYLPRLKAWDGKDFFNRIITERKGEIPSYFFPVDVWAENRGFGEKLDFGNMNYLELLWYASMTYCWMVAKPEYQIPATLLPEVLKTEFNGKLPLSLLKTIPHWSGYVDLSACPIPHPYDEGVIEGIILSTVTHWSGREGLTIVYPYDSTGMARSIFFPFEGDMTLDDVIKSDPTFLRDCEQYNIPPEKTVEVSKEEGYWKTFTQLLNVALFVAQDFDTQFAVNFRTGFRLNYMKRSGRKISLPFLNAHRKYPVGEDYLRELSDSEGGKNGTSRRAHIRRAHYHGYWIGPRNQPEKRTLKIKWVRTSIVSATGEKDGHD